MRCLWLGCQTLQKAGTASIGVKQLLSCQLLQADPILKLRLRSRATVHPCREHSCLVDELRLRWLCASLRKRGLCRAPSTKRLQSPRPQPQHSAR